MVTIVKNGTIVTNKTEYIADVKIERGIIIDIGSFGDIVGAEAYDASGSFLFPGFIDSHTHLDMGSGERKTADDFFSGSKAAIAGGTTTLIDFATQEKGGTLADALTEWKSKAADKAYCDYGFHMAIIDWNQNVKAEMSQMIDSGVPTFKMYMAYKNVLQLDDGIIYEALKEAVAIGGLIGFHCENGDVIEARSKELVSLGKTTPYYHQISRPEIVESEAIYRLTQVATLANAPIWVVHLSTKKGLEIIKEMKSKGVAIVAETCPQYLVLDNSCYGEPKDTNFEIAKYVISPPIRDKANQQPLWNALKNGDIDFVSTDHCSFNLKGQKELGKEDFSKIPNGAPGLQHRIPIMYSCGVCEGQITINEMVDICATKPADKMGLVQKGSIEVGKDADIVIFNPNKSGTIKASEQFQNVDYTPYEGMATKGEVEKVFLRGDLVYDQGSFRTEPKGQFIRRKSKKFI